MMMKKKYDNAVDDDEQLFIHSEPVCAVKVRFTHEQLMSRHRRPRCSYWR